MKRNPRETAPKTARPKCDGCHFLAQVGKSASDQARPLNCGYAFCISAARGGERSAGPRVDARRSGQINLGVWFLVVGGLVLAVYAAARAQGGVFSQVCVAPLLRWWCTGRHRLGRAGEPVCGRKRGWSDLPVVIPSLNPLRLPSKRLRNRHLAWQPIRCHASSAESTLMFAAAIIAGSSDAVLGSSRALAST